MQITYQQIIDAVREQCPDRYPMELARPDGAVVEQAVNQGIDSRLEACYSPDCGDLYEWEQRRFGAKLNCVVSAESMPVLLRRLSESGNENGELLASDILGTLGFRVETGCYEIVSPVDVPAE